MFITHNDLSLPNGINVIKQLSNKKMLKSLALNSCKLTNTHLEELNVALKDHENIKELYLYSNNIGPKETIQVSNII